MTDLIDSNALACSGRALPADLQARNVRRWGWWYQAEWRLRNMRAYWSAMLGASVLTPLVYVLAMGLGLGTLVDASAGGVDGMPYLTFVGPGLLISTVVMSAVEEMTYPVMEGFKWRKLYWARATSPGSATQVALGELTAVTIRLLAQGLAFWLVLLAFGVAGPGSWPMVVVGALAGMAFGAPVMAFAATREDEGNSFSLIQRFVVMPMFLFAGTFFPLDSMPWYLQWIGWISPMWHGNQVARVFAYGLPLPAWQIAGHVAFLAVLCAAGAALGVRTFVRRLGR